MNESQRLQPHSCPICGKFKFEQHGSFDICPNCGWEDDIVQETDPDYAVGANHMSLNEYKEKYESGWRPEWLTEL